MKVKSVHEATRAYVWNDPAFLEGQQQSELA